MPKDFDILAYLMGKKAGSGGGGGDITVESKSISANGTYTAPTGKAYSPVSVSVPNSYAAGDEGKVVSNGALVAQSSDSVTQNGTVDTTLINTLTVNVSGVGGGLEYEEGIWTPASDMANSSEILFSNIHTSAPLFVLLADAEDADTSSKDTNIFTCLVNMNLFLGHPCATVNAPVSRYGANVYGYAAQGSTTVNLGNTSATSSLGVEQNFFDSAGFWAKTNSNSRYWLSGRTYKWIAVWLTTA